MILSERNKKCKKCGSCCTWNIADLKIRCLFLMKNNLCYLYRYRNFLAPLTLFCWLGPFIRRKDCAVRPIKENASRWDNFCDSLFVFIVGVLMLLALFLIYFIFHWLWMRCLVLFAKN